MKEAFTVKGKVEAFDMPGGRVYVSVPKEHTEATKVLSQRGFVPITVTLNNSIWHTSLMPMGDGTQFIALNAKVRKIEGIQVGDTVRLTYHVRER